jgi:hypothetical protein
VKEAYRAVNGRVQLDIVFENSITYPLAEIADVFTKEAQNLDQQGSLKTLIIP